MKGTIAICLRDLVINQFGQDKWTESLRNAGLSEYTIFLPISDVDDEQVLKLVGGVCKALNISLSQAADAFGEYWVNVYSQKLYSIYYKGNKTARDFLLNMDDVHVQMTKSMKNARPPRFNYEWKNDNTLIIRYLSHRNLIDFAVGLVKGVGTFYKENLQVEKLDDERIQVTFP